MSSVTLVNWLTVGLPMSEGAAPSMPARTRYEPAPGTLLQVSVRGELTVEPSMGVSSSGRTFVMQLTGGV